MHSPQESTIVINNGEQSIQFALSHLLKPLSEGFPVGQLFSAIDSACMITNQQSEVWKQLQTRVGITHIQFGLADDETEGPSFFQALIADICGEEVGNQSLFANLPLLVLFGQIPLLEAQLTVQPTCVHARDGNERTLLMIAAARGDTKTVQMLLKRGADPLAQSRDGKNALMYALSGKHVETAQALLAHQPDISSLMVQQKDMFDNTALHYCVHRYQDEDPALEGLKVIAKQLHELGVSLTTKNASGKSSLSEAAQCNDAMSKFLASLIVCIEKDHIVNAQMLRDAVYHGDIHSVRAILRLVPYRDIAWHTRRKDQHYKMKPAMLFGEVDTKIKNLMLGDQAFTPLLFIVLYRWREQPNFLPIIDALLQAGEKHEFSFTCDYQTLEYYEGVPYTVDRNQRVSVTAVELALRMGCLPAVTSLANNHRLPQCGTAVLHFATVFSPIITNPQTTQEHLLNCAQLSCAEYIVLKANEISRQSTVLFSLRKRTTFQDSDGIKRAVAFFNTIKAAHQQGQLGLMNQAMEGLLKINLRRGQASRTTEGSFVRCFLDWFVKDQALCNRYSVRPNVYGLSSYDEAVSIRKQLHFMAENTSGNDESYTGPGFRQTESSEE